MFKRLFTLFFGLGLGLLVGAFVVKRLDEASKAVAPNNVARNAGRAAGSLADRFNAAIAEGKGLAAEREAELRANFDIPSVSRALGRE